MIRKTNRKTPYQIFLRKELAIIKAKQPNIKHINAMKRVSRNWRSSPDNPKTKEKNSIIKLNNESKNITVPKNITESKKQKQERIRNKLKELEKEILEMMETEAETKNYNQAEIIQVEQVEDTRTKNKTEQNDYVEEQIMKNKENDEEVRSEDTINCDTNNDVDNDVNKPEPVNGIEA